MLVAELQALCWWAKKIIIIIIIKRRLISRRNMPEDFTRARYLRSSALTFCRSCRRTTEYQLSCFMLANWWRSACCCEIFKFRLWDKVRQRWEYPHFWCTRCRMGRRKPLCQKSARFVRIRQRPMTDKQAASDSVADNCAHSIIIFTHL